MKVEFVKSVKFQAKSGKYFYYIVVNDKIPYLNGGSIPKTFFVSFDYGEKLLAHRNNIHKGYDKDKNREFLYVSISSSGQDYCLNQVDNAVETDIDIPF